LCLLLRCSCTGTTFNCRERQVELIGLGGPDRVTLTSASNVPLTDNLINIGPGAVVTVQGITFDNVKFAESSKTIGLFSVTEQGK
jgi:hypothetical protein